MATTRRPAHWWACWQCGVPNNPANDKCTSCLSPRTPQPLTTRAFDNQTAHTRANPLARLAGGLVVLGLIWFSFLRTGSPGAPLLGGPDTGGWEKNWNDTTCAEYQTKMTQSERMAFARWSLTLLRENTLPSAPAPDAASITRFSSAIAATCSESYTGADYPLVAAGVVVYTTDTSYEPAYR